MDLKAGIPYHGGIPGAIQFVEEQPVVVLKRIEQPEGLPPAYQASIPGWPGAVEVRGNQDEALGRLIRLHGRRLGIEVTPFDPPI